MYILSLMSALALIIGFIALAKRGRRKSLVPVKFQIQLTLGALVNDGAVAVATVGTLQQDFDIVTTHMVIAMRDHTAGEGPIEFGIAESQYTVAEIVEALDASPLSQYGVEQERSSRKVRTAGQLPGLLGEEALNDGNKIKVKLFVKAFGNDNTNMMQFFAVNRSGATLTTGTAVEVTGVHWGRWK